MSFWINELTNKDVVVELITNVTKRGKILSCQDGFLCLAIETDRVVFIAVTSIVWIEEC